MPILLIIIIIVSSLLVGSGIGWTIKDWKDGAKMAALESRDAVVTAANAQCKTDVKSVQASVAGIIKAADERTKTAEAEMTKAQKAAAWHSARAAEMHNGLPPKPDETQCQTIEREQAKYVQSRRSDS